MGLVHLTQNELDKKLDVLEELTTEEFVNGIRQVGTKLFPLVKVTIDYASVYIRVYVKSDNGLTIHTFFNASKTIGDVVHLGHFDLNVIDKMRGES